jgi:hypothetical protein
MARVVERIFSLRVNSSILVRVWMACHDLHDTFEARTLRADIRLAVYTTPVTPLTDVAIAERIALLPSCNAVEVIDQYKSATEEGGVLIYPEWP